MNEWDHEDSKMEETDLKPRQSWLNSYFDTAHFLTTTEGDLAKFSKLNRQQKLNAV